MSGRGGTDRRVGIGLVCCLLLCASLVAIPAAGGIGTTTAEEKPTTEATTEKPTTEKPTTETAEPGAASDGVTIDSALESTDANGGTVEVIVRLAEADVGDSDSEFEFGPELESESSSAPGPASPDRITDALKRHAAESQEAIVTYAETTDGVTVRNQFWLTNAVLLEVDTSTVDLASFERVVEADQTVDIELEAGHELTVDVHDADGEPVGSVNVVDDVGSNFKDDIPIPGFGIGPALLAVVLLLVALGARLRTRLSA
ncbi:hypothetical protein GS429_13945 [Natronorubrum sp. JWXQ-INN-674]|uniref:PGF-CTERM sorting domain-containing protein n=1 Tax=Natronorubrum halalkaliphilum TaxID=2691917 RepID=A0A6B0VNH2_9EURY|nr:hypothetical protein [Natronorubrum halalkaliphilum]MXV63150.1 hypothetical protein [Natronorubrum halalkaliphilum]